MVPEPITRVGGSFEIRVAIWVMTSTGLVATTRMASGAAASTCGMIALNTAALRSRSWMRVSPGFWLTPAVRMTTSAPSRSA